MNPADSPALEQALAGFRRPRLYADLRERPLPDDVLLLIRIAAGDAQARAHAAAVSGETAAVVGEAAALFIQQVMFFPGGDSFRVLGVAAMATGPRIKEHHRWLARWLHPDRNSDEWDAVYADRVNHAWQDLRTSERRRDYEARLKSAGHAPALPASAASGVSARRGARPHADDYLLSARTAKRLPALILGGLAIGSVAVLGLQYQLTRKEWRDDVVPMSAGRPAAQGQAPALRPPTIAMHPTPPAPVVAVRPAPVVAVRPAPPLSTKAGVPAAVVKPLPVEVLPVPRLRLPRLAPPAAAISDAQAASAASVVTGEPHRVVAEPASDVPAAAITPLPPQALIDAAIAKDVITRFRRAYFSGNINQMRGLLASPAGDYGPERKTIMRTYSKLFESSARRRIEIHDASWFTDGDTAILIATYEAWIMPRGETLERRFAGNIRFDLRREGGELRVARLRHDSVGG